MYYIKKIRRQRFSINKETNFVLINAILIQTYSVCIKTNREISLIM